MKKLALALALALLLCVALTFLGCAMLEEKGITPESVEAAGTTVSAAGKILPGLPGASVEVIGWLLAVIATSWGTWKRTQGNRYKKAFVSTARGIDKAEDAMPADALKTLHESLFKEQSKADAIETVAELRSD